MTQGEIAHYANVFQNFVSYRGVKMCLGKEIKKCLEKITARLTDKHMDKPTDREVINIHVSPPKDRLSKNKENTFASMPLICLVVTIFHVQTHFDKEFFSTL